MTDPSPAAPVARSLLLALVAITSIGPLSMQLFVPALPFIVRDFGVTVAQAQWALSLSMAALAVATLIYGPASDRFGRRPVLWFGLLLFAFGSAVSMVAPTVEVLVAGRILQATGGACGLVVSRAIVRDLYGPVRSASIMAYLTVAMVVAPMGALVVGGVLTDAYGWRLTFTFALACGALVLVAMTQLPETGHRTHAPLTAQALFAGYGVLLRSRTFAGYAVHVAFAAGTFFAFMAAAPHLMVTALGRPATEFSLYFVIVSLAFMGASYLGGRLSPRVGIKRLVLLGGGVMTVAAAGSLVALLSLELSPPLLFSMATFVSVGCGLSMPNANAGAINVAPRLAGTASGAVAFAQMMTGAVIAQALGWVIDPSGTLLVVTVLAAALLALAGAVLACLGERAPLAAELAAAHRDAAA